MKSEKYDFLYKDFDNTLPEVNPISYQSSRYYTGPSLGDAGKLYLKRERMNDLSYEDFDNYSYGVPAVWECPFGFDYDGFAWWTTQSEMLAVRHYRTYKNAQNKLKVAFDEIIKKQDYIYDLSKAIDSSINLPDYKSGFEARPHQKVGVEFGRLANGRFIIADQQRTGKSYTSLMYALSQTWDKCLIVCPAKLTGIWGSEQGVDGKVRNGMIRTICDNPIKILKSNDFLVDGFNVVSYDILHTISNLDCDIVIADEAHFFLEEGARRSKAVNSINADKKIALTGTPIMNNISDIMSIVDWVNPEIAEELKAVLNAIRGENSYEQALIVGEELKRRCLLLRETNQVSTSREPYINFIEIDAKLDNPKDLKEVGRAKVNFAVEYLNSFTEKVLVVFYYRETGKMLKARLGNKAALIDGNSSKQEVDDGIKGFAGDTQFLIASSIISEGFDFSHCNTILLLEEPNYSMRTDQIRERCNRVNKTEEVTLDIVVVPNTQDDRVYELVDRKYNYQYGLRDS